MLLVINKLCANAAAADCCCTVLNHYLQQKSPFSLLQLNKPLTMPCLFFIVEISLL